MRYIFVSLGKLESFGIRLGGAGLGNILFPWARAIVYAKKNNLQRIQTTWKNLKFGTFIRREKDKRMYFDLFTGNDGIRGLKKFLLLNFSNKVKIFSGMENLFESFKDEHSFVQSELLKIINPYHIRKAREFDRNSIAVHIRLGDFQVAEDEEKLRGGHWNYRLPFKWYKNIIEKRVSYICSDMCLISFLPFSGLDRIDIANACFGDGKNPCKKCKREWYN